MSFVIYCRLKGILDEVDDLIIVSSSLDRHPIVVDEDDG